MKIKKYSIRILLTFIFLVILVAAFQFYISYKAEKNYDAVQEEYYKQIPNIIDSYPDVKRDAESFKTQYDIMIDSDVGAKAVYGPFPMSQEATLGVLDCSLLIGQIKDFKSDGLSLFKNEIENQDYFKMEKEKNAFDGIPSIANRFKEFNRDNKISYIEYCTINTMLMLFFKHRTDLQHDGSLSEVKARLNE